VVEGGSCGKDGLERLECVVVEGEEEVGLADEGGLGD
jgi:hypothetical protein